MYPAPSTRFIPALAYSHRVATLVELIRTNGTTEVLEHTGGSVTVDRKQVPRRTCTVTVADPALIPRTPADKLSVYGAKLRISRGITYGDGSTELAPIGYFRVDQVTGDPDIGPVTITGSGLEAAIVDDVFRTPTTVASATTAVTGITQLIQATLPGATVISRATNAAVGTMSWDAQTSRWDAITALATAIGAEVYADAGGTFVIAPLPDLLASSVVWEVAAGEGGVMISANRGMSRAGVFNSITAYGENLVDGAAPVSATVEDTDPTSPTYVNGPFGRVVGDDYTSATLVTTAQCTAAATQLLKTALKPNATADITSLPNPLLEPGDVIRGVYLDGTRELHQIASFEIGLDTTAAMVIATIAAKGDS
ncbi:DUF5047 domain-containing protein [Streptomyces cocklensis]|uniref:DUF5047 domain-containing protein n=1 Tax=Actinacidiphila cocklensis TaxID=887465 RepID=A0A9W4DMC9_9ACTN|nr:DUF5047 domain-containing protein [Actinacidiphila cocklensis]MDD1057917.1 DUF5047 domain-containing protein [Actinacidiphila cocklensis]CAG6392782.1 conserved hypothetical protein [Actinacidiphila cocklensis]